MAPVSKQNINFQWVIFWAKGRSSHPDKAVAKSHLSKQRQLRISNEGEVWKLAVFERICWCCTHSVSVTELEITASGQQSGPCLSNGRRNRSQSMNRDCSLLNRIQPPWQGSFNVILFVLWQAPTRWAVAGRGKFGTKQIKQHEASAVRPEDVAARAQKRCKKCSANSKCSLKWFVAWTLWCCITSALFPNTLNLPEVKPHPLLLLSWLSPTFSYVGGLKPLLFILASSLSVFVSECK